MWFEKFSKENILCSTNIFSLIIILYFSAKYGWKLYGFKYCENPDSIWVRLIDVSESKVLLKGDTSESASSFVGYNYKIDGDRLYIGLKYNSLLGFTKRIGAFDITLDCDTSKINSIALLGQNNVEIVWNR